MLQAIDMTGWNKNKKEKRGKEERNGIQVSKKFQKQESKQISRDT